jgi:TolB protein
MPSEPVLAFVSGSGKMSPSLRLLRRSAMRGRSLAVLAAIPALSVGLASASSTLPLDGRIVVVCLVADPLAYQICSLRPDGTGWKQLTRGPERIDSTDPHLSPDGRSIVFERGPNEGKTDTYVMGAGGGGVRRLTHCGACDGEVAPTFSPDGRTIAFERAAGRGNDGIAVMDAQGTRVRPLTRGAGEGRYYDTDPSFSPDGKRLVFSRVDDSSRRAALFTLALAGGTAVRITPWALGAGAADWSPDGKLIVFSSYRHEDLRPGISRNVYVVRPDGTGLRALTRFEGGVVQSYDAAWSPDGRWVAFTREHNAQRRPGVHGDQDLYVMRGDGTELRRIAARPQGGHSLDWGR